MDLSERRGIQSDLMAKSHRSGLSLPPFVLYLSIPVPRQWKKAYKQQRVKTQIEESPCRKSWHVGSITLPSCLVLNHE